MKDLYIIGTGSQARYVVEICKHYNIKGLIEILDRKNIESIINGVKVVCFIDDVDNCIDRNNSEIILAYGKNDKKEELANFLLNKGFKFARAISDKAYISSFVEIGYGSIINPGVDIMPNVRIGNHVIIHSGSVIEHDNDISDYVNIAPGVITAGGVKIGKGSYIYSGAVVASNINIGKHVIVGAGSVVLKNVEDNLTVVGVPAKVLDRTGKDG